MSQQSSSSKKRVYITAEQKRELCILKRSKPEPKILILKKKCRSSPNWPQRISCHSGFFLLVP